MRSPVTRLAAVLAATALLAVAPHAQDTNPTQGRQFRGVTRLVPVWATVRDKGGAFQLELTKDDFEIRDNGKVQEITQFTREAQPLSVVVMMDGSSSMMPVFNAVLDGVNQFVIRLMPGDEGRIASFADRTRMSPGFTKNRDDLLEYLKDQFNIRMANDTRLWDALSDAVGAVAQRKGRRVVVVFTDGDDTSSSLSEGSVAAAASKTDTMVYAVAMWSHDPNSNARSRPNPRIEQLATQTGGGFYELHEHDDMNATFTGIAEELHNQYVLGFTPAALDGKEHKLEVTVKRPDMLVRARRAYVANQDSIGGSSQR